MNSSSLPAYAQAAQNAAPARWVVAATASVDAAKRKGWRVLSTEYSVASSKSSAANNCVLGTAYSVLVSAHPSITSPATRTRVPGVSRRAEQEHGPRHQRFPEQGLLVTRGGAFWENITTCSQLNFPRIWGWSSIG